MTFWLVGYVVCGVLSGAIAARLDYCYFQGRFPERNRRRDAGGAIARSMIVVILWPVLLPVTYCMSGFAEHGFWKVRS